MLFNAVLALGLRTLLQWENRKLDRKFGIVGRVDGDGKTEDGIEGGAGGILEGGDENDGPRFRYVL